MARTRTKNFLESFGLGSGARIKQIHPPPNPSPRTLKGEDKDFWEAVRQSAYGYYSTSGAPEPKKVAEISAWKALRARQGLQNVWKGSRAEIVPASKPRPYVLRLDVPVIPIGPMLEHTWIDQQTGDITVSKWDKDDAPTLWWNKAKKELLSYPHVIDPDVCHPIGEGLEDVISEYKMFYQRKPDCETRMRVPAGQIKPIGLADSIVYVSDKWHEKNPDRHKRGSQEYFHQNSDGTWIFQDTIEDPSMVRIHGGMLDVESRGIIH